MHDNQPLVMVGQLIYIAFWTWLLNMICKINTGISWAIVLFPFILFFIIFLAVVFSGREGMEDKEEEEEKEGMKDETKNPVSPVDQMSNMGVV